MADIQQLIQSILAQGKNKLSSIPPVDQQLQQIQSQTPEQMQSQAMKLVMAGTVGTPQPLLGNQPKIAGTLLDVSNLKNLSPDDYMNTINNVRSIASELIPKQANSKVMNKLANKDVETWMQKVAQQIIKKTGVYPSMAQ